MSLKLARSFKLWILWLRIYNRKRISKTNLSKENITSLWLNNNQENQIKGRLNTHVCGWILFCWTSLTLTFLLVVFVSTALTTTIFSLSELFGRWEPWSLSPSPLLVLNFLGQTTLVVTLSGTSHYDCNPIGYIVLPYAST